MRLHIVPYDLSDGMAPVNGSYTINADVSAPELSTYGPDVYVNTADGTPYADALSHADATRPPTREYRYRDCERGDWWTAGRNGHTDGEEVVAKLVVEHDEMLAVQMFAREQFAAISAMAPGTSVAFGVQVQPCMGLLSFLVERDGVEVTVDLGEGAMPFSEPLPRHAELVSASILQPRAMSREDGWTLKQVQGDGVSGEGLTVMDLAYTRSGEKGETINIGIIARKTDDLPTLRAALTPEALRTHLADLGEFKVTIHEVPGIHALNIVLGGALPGGLNASQWLDPAAKSIGQRVLAMRFNASSAMMASR